MPVTIKEMPKQTRGRESKYDLTPLFDGKAYVLVRGTKDEEKAGKADFSCERVSMRANLYRAAREAGVEIRSAFTEHDGREAIAVTVKQDKNGNDKAEAKS